jgi:hypothetical protein
MIPLFIQVGIFLVFDTHLVVFIPSVLLKKISLMHTL